MHFRVLLIILSILVTNLLKSQTNVELYTTISYNYFSMKSLKGFQKSLLLDLQSENIPAEIVEDYPSFWGYQTGFSVPVKELENFTVYSGGFIGYTSTGGRINYSDYSGEVNVDQIIDVINVGAALGFQKFYLENFNMKYQLSVNYCYSDLSIDFYSKIGDIKESQNLEFTSSSFAVDLSLIPTIKEWSIFIGFPISYHFYIPSNLNYSKFSEAILQTSSGEKVEVDWSGIRVGIQFGILL